MRKGNLKLVARREKEYGRMEGGRVGGTGRRREGLMMHASKKRMKVMMLMLMLMMMLLLMMLMMMMTVTIIRQ